MTTRWVKREIKAMKKNKAMQDPLHEGEIEPIVSGIELVDAEVSAHRKASKKALKFAACIVRVALPGDKETFVGLSAICGEKAGGKLEDISLEALRREVKKILQCMREPLTVTTDSDWNEIEDDANIREELNRFFVNNLSAMAMIVAGP